MSRLNESEAEPVAHVPEVWARTSLANEDRFALRIRVLRRLIDQSARRAAIALHGSAPGIGICYVIALAYICALAAYPEFRDRVPSWLTWFGAPGSFVSIVVVLSFPGLYFLGRSLTNRPLVPAVPLLALTAMAASCVVLGMSTYWRCHETQTPFFAPLAWTLHLFVGDVDNPFGPVPGAEGCRQYAVPLALEIGRLLGISTTLTTALAATLKIFHAQLDRVAIWRARSLTVVVAIDAESASMVEAIAQKMGRAETLVVLTEDAERRAVAQARAAGARVRVVNWSEPGMLAQVRVWDRVERLYLLSEDPVNNLARFKTINAQVERLRPGIRRLPVVVRMDDPWQADTWRRNHMSEFPWWVADAVGRYEMTAAKLVRQLARTTSVEGELRPPEVILLCGLDPLTYALTSELAQAQRDQDVFCRTDVALPARVVIFAAGAEGFVEDHRLRQARMAPDGPALSVTAHEEDATVEAISRYLAGDPAPDRAVPPNESPSPFGTASPNAVDVNKCAAILTGPSMEYAGTRLATRFPNLRVYQASRTAGALADFRTIGHLHAFPINLKIEADAPQDVWERAARLIHEQYAQGIAEDDGRTPATQHWENLDNFYRQSNRREVVNALWMVEEHAGFSWNALESPPAQPLPDNFPFKCARCRLRDLGFGDAVKDLKSDGRSAVDAMIEDEHEDWYRFYIANGWRYGSPRSYIRRRHEKLRHWDSLDDDAKRQSAESLALTLSNLRSLGYRAAPPTPEPMVVQDQECVDCTRWSRYRRKGDVTAEQRDHAWNWTSEAGEAMHADAGDWAVMDDAGHARSVRADVFESTHLQVGPGRYRRSGTVHARRVLCEQTVKTLEGEHVAHLGDWIVKGQRGEQWPVPDEQFRKSHEGPLTDGGT